jgi:nucleoside 2-deoxyribosyltransferase
MLWYRERLLPMLRRHVRVIDPWAYLGASVAPPPDRERLLAIGRRNFAGIRDEADMVVAVLDQEPPDIGTVAEVAAAAGWGKPVVGYRGDVRSCGEAGGPYNVMVVVAVEMSGGREVASLADLEEAVCELVASWGDGAFARLLADPETRRSLDDSAARFGRGETRPIEHAEARRIVGLSPVVAAAVEAPAPFFR